MSRDQVQEIIANSEADVIDQLHDLAMSKTPETAAMGRLMKRLVPQVMQWAEGEVERGGDRGSSMVCIPNVMASITVLAATMLIEGPASKELMQSLRDDLISKLDNTIARQLDSQDAHIKKMTGMTLDQALAEFRLSRSS